MIKAVVIDFDDTLCLTELACFKLENAILVLLDQKPQTREIHKRTWGRPLFEAISERSPGVDVDKFRKIFNEMFPLWIAEGRKDAISKKSLDSLDLLLKQGKELYILTSREHDEVKHLLEPDHYLADRIKAFYYRNVMTYHKPDPRAFDEVLNDHGLKRSECVHVGDSPSDAVAAKQAGLHFIASLESGVRTKADFSTLPVDAFVNTFSDIPSVISKL